MNDDFRTRDEVPTETIEDELARYPHSESAQQLACIINEKLSLFGPHTSNYGSVCIYKVPQKFRKKNPLAYTPRSISIGPLHYGETQLQRMEEYKLKYLYNFLQTFRVLSWQLAAFMERQEKLVYACYEMNCTSKLEQSPSVKLSQVILLDGVFMIELFLKSHFHEMRESGDIIFENPWISKDITETFFCNLIAFEQTGYNSKSITSYIILLDNLIDTPKDVDILIHHGIINNQLPTSDQVAEVFNNLYKEVVTDAKDFDFAETCLDLNDYSKSWLHKLRSVYTKTSASLKQDYFSTPLSTISVAGAFIVIVLTVIQTVCALISL